VLPRTIVKLLTKPGFLDIGHADNEENKSTLRVVQEYFFSIEKNAAADKRDAGSGLLVASG
jgi:hypothetical protein